MENEYLHFADKHLAPYRVRGDELIPDLCPFCHGGDSGDKYSFALNLSDGLYVCKRGGCGVRGRFESLAAHFGERISDLRIITPKSKKTFVLPDTILLPPTDEILSYFASRKIGAATLATFKISADKNGSIVFPFYRDGVRIFEKYRHPRKLQPKERKEWQFPGAQSILFGMDLCSFSQPLIITEGQIDCLSLYEAGIHNCVSVPSGCTNLDWIDSCWDWLERFQNIILFGDNDDPGRKMIREVVRRLDEARCSIVSDYPDRPDGTPCKDANDVLLFWGPER